MHGLIDRFEAGFLQLTHFFAALVAISIGVIALLIPLNLLLVKTGLGGIWWLFEGVEYILYFGVFLGAPWVLQQGAHVRVDIVVSALPTRLSERLEKFLDVAGCGLCLFLLYYGMRAVLSEFEDGTLPDKDLRIANWKVLSVYSVGLLLLAIEFLFRLRPVRVSFRKAEVATDKAEL